MANEKKYAVVRTDNMFGTDVRAGLVSVKYMGADGSAPEAIENGCVVKLKELAEGEREVYVGVTPTAEDALNDIVLLAAPEVMYDERKKNLDEYINEKDKPIRGYCMHEGNFFGLTAEGFVGTPAKGNIVELTAGTKLNAVASATGSATKVGKIVDVENAGRYTYYVVRIGA